MGGMGGVGGSARAEETTLRSPLPGGFGLPGGCEQFVDEFPL